mgnify:CR=1 FL=1
MQGVIYARYSSDNQREESIEGQIRENTAYAQKNGIDIVGTYIDRAYSAKTDNRPEFQRMIKDSAKKGFDVVIVWKLDRFSRNRYDSAKYKAMLRKNDVKVVSATESISEGAEGIILESVLEGMAEYYSADLAEKVSRGMTENALKCRFNGGNIPFGYMIDEEQHYQPDPEKAPLVIEMFRRYAGGESITDIVEDLNARGIRTSKGNRFNKNSLARIFANRRYIGEYAYKEIVVPNAIPPIVSKDIFERVAIRMKQNKHATGKAKAPEKYLLTTKLFCGTCQSMFVGDSANKPNGTIYRYYKCASAKRHECDRKAIRKDWIEDKVIEEISAWLNDNKTVSKMADDVMALLDADNEMVLALEAQLKGVRDSIDNIMKAIEKDPLDRVASVKSEIDFVLAREEFCKTLENARIAGTLPLRVTHNDTKLNNILFDAKTGKALCVVDLDTIMPGYAMNDFGDSIRFGANHSKEDEKDLSKVNFDIELYEAYTRGFLEGAKGSLTPAELEYLPWGAKLMTLECGIRFLTDYLDGDHYFRIHYPEQNLDRCRTQLKLVADMESKWQAMEAIVQEF